MASASSDAAKLVGDNTGTNKPLGEMGSPGHVLAHAALGCAAAAATGKDCAPGALGGGASALVGSFLPDPQGLGDKALMAGALTFTGGVAAQAAGYDGVTAAQAASNEALNNRMMHWRDFEEQHAQCQNAPNADGCQTILKMGGERSRVLPDFLQLPDSKVIANYDGAGNLVSYTISDRQSNQPLLVMEPAEYQAYRNAPLATRGHYLLAPQWSLDLSSAVVYAGMGDAQRAQEHFGYVLSSPEYWLTAGAGVLGGVAGRAAVVRGAAGGVANNSVRKTVLVNIAETRAGNASSNFGTFVRNEGRLQEALDIWPPNSGRVGPVTTIELQPGQVIYRYGLPSGRYVSPQGTTFAERALPSSYESTKPYFQYEVVQPLPEVTQSRALPWFGQPGMGTQYELPKSIEWYLDNGFLRVK